jgi:hypothetical protein
MPVPLYMDVHVPQAVTAQLRLRGIDVVTAIEDRTDELEDDALLQHVAGTGRVLFTQDIRFRALAEDWIRQGRPFSGLVFGRQLGASIGQLVRDLELVAAASEPGEWDNRVEHIPF